MTDQVLEAFPTAERLSPAALRLVQTAQAFIAEGSADSATVEDVIQRAGVSKRSFYNHFADRDALMRQVIDEACQAMQAHLERVRDAAQEPAACFLQVAVGCWAYCSAERFRQQVLTRAVHDAQGLDVAGLAPVLQTLAAGIDAGVLAPASPEAGQALVLGTCLLGSAQLQRLGPASKGATALAHDMALLLLRGLRVDRRRQASLAKQAVAIAWAGRTARAA